MRKQDLKDGMILETRNGNRYLLTNGVMRDFEGWLPLIYYNDDLISKYYTDHDIVKVYKETTTYSLTGIFKDENLTLLWERKELKLTDREIEVLKALKLLGFKYIARDSDNDLYAYQYEPEKNDYIWEGSYGGFVNYITYTELFNFIKWEDVEPTIIDDLLKGV